MRCPQCGAWSLVLETRGPRRRRTCGNNHRYTTIEISFKDWREQQRQQKQRLVRARQTLRNKGYLK
jgi:transcriptional regulator NrdR family protein